MLGIDVAARRGLDLVLLTATGALAADPCRAQPADLPALLDTWRPDVVAIDAPCAWASAGARSRPAERALAALGIRSYYTPDAEQSASAFYDWVRTGMRTYETGASAGYRLYDGHGWRGPTMCEVFPHATTVAVLGGVPTTRPAAEKRRVRRAALAAVGIDDVRLGTIDQVDAALAAFTGLRLMQGAAGAVGDMETGFVVLPVPVPPRRYRRFDPLIDGNDQNAGGA